MKAVRKILILIIMLSAAMMVKASYNILNEIQLERQRTTSDSYARNRVVLLNGKHGQCTGVQVQAASGLVYTLTAAHCVDILEDGKAMSVLENGVSKQVAMLEIDKTADLMLMSAVSTDTLPVAAHIYKYDHVHTMTHGNGLPTYRTDGMVLKNQEIAITMFEIETADDEVRCLDNPTQQISPTMPPYCMKNLHSLAASAQVIPGSSGGPLLNEENQIVGIASATQFGSPIGFFVTLEDIHKFLADK